ncbi:hypothetical protein [Salmonella sp. ZJCDC-24]|uniref:hypothetical protein n=1 Tax=Salmonella sp. ZJCDC-24 TaxID=3159612 RepID=UPI00126D6A17|nr:hypothetical protein [Salmonella enterica]EAP0377787.1 hypothetical protein [Salmonella enterica]EBQ7678857.1 hypothetical protein [Salmonella enterica]
MRNLLGLLLILVAAMSAGWQAHDWHDAKLKLAASEAAEQTRQIVVEVTQQSGEALEAKLAELRANEIHTERVIRTETIKPVFSNVCASDDYVRLFNESADQAERKLSGKPSDTLPGHVATSGRTDRK